MKLPVLAYVGIVDDARDYYAHLATIGAESVWCEEIENKYYILCVGWLWRVLFHPSKPCCFSRVSPNKSNYIDVAQNTNFWGLRRRVSCLVDEYGLLSRSKVEWKVVQQFCVE